MKIIIIATVFLCFFGIGMYIFNRYRVRKIFFQNVTAFCEHLLIEISFQKNTIRNIISIYGNSYAKHFYNLLHLYNDIIEKKQDITRDRIAGILDPKILKNHEIAILTDFFCDLGRHGAIQEKQKIETKRDAFREILKTCTELLKRDASIYLKLFIFMGVGAVLLII